MKGTLENEVERIIHWFTINGFQANPHKFQGLLISRKVKVPLEFKFGTSSIKTEENIKILGVTIDCHLSFATHVTDLCKKASRQVNALKRLRHYLPIEHKLNIFKAFIVSNFLCCCKTICFVASITQTSWRRSRNEL